MWTNLLRYPDFKCGQRHEINRLSLLLVLTVFFFYHEPLLATVRLDNELRSVTPMAEELQQWSIESHAVAGCAVVVDHNDKLWFKVASSPSPELNMAYEDARERLLNLLCERAGQYASSTVSPDEHSRALLDRLLVGTQESSEVKRDQRPYGVVYRQFLVHSIPWERIEWFTEEYRATQQLQFQRKALGGVCSLVTLFACFGGALACDRVTRGYHPRIVFVVASLVLLFGSMASCALAWW